MNEHLGKGDPRKDLFSSPSVFEAARIVGAAVRDVHTTDGEALRQHDVEFNATFVFGGQIKGQSLRLFQLYAAGNFIEATRDTPFLQIGEIKYGKPILDRIITPGVSLVDAAKCALISFDSTMRSNVSVGPPIDVMLYRRDALEMGLRVRLEERDPYLQPIHRLWGGALQKAFYDTVPNPDWSV